ncbi:MAG TPA: T9SS type A sorting domain-containing protein, partial [Flavobacteriales bacterium]|nr:T9SS type A sorting domain-containing protein [Flavobacteriales bacterium]
MRTLLAISLLLLSLSTRAQAVGQYTISPNWTATDIQGNSHTLYDYLDQGYTVVLDFSTTWCPPCAAFHQAHTLNDLYTAYGPGTAADKVMVFLVECDSTTDMADLNGTGDQSSIDWITGTDYPIIDDASIAPLYGVYGYPMIYTICPTRMISALSYQASVSYMWSQCQVCDHHQVDSSHDATLLGGQQEVTCIDPAAPLHTTLYNIGTAPLTSATIEAVEVYGGTVVSTGTWTGSLPTYGQAGVDLPAWDAPPGQQGFYFRITSPDDDAANDSILPEYHYMRSPSSLGTALTIEVLTDAHGGEISWRLEQNPGGLVDRRDEGAYADNTLYTHAYDLQPGVCYRFIFFDTGGDGLQAPAHFALRNGATPFITTTECHHEDFGTLVVDEAYFVVEESTGIPEHNEATIGLVPNPANDRVQLTGAPAGSTVSLFDATGRLVMRTPMSATTASVDVSALPQGSYVLTVSDRNSSVARHL